MRYTRLSIVITLMLLLSVTSAFGWYQDSISLGTGGLYTKGGGIEMETSGGSDLFKLVKATGAWTWSGPSAVFTSSASTATSLSIVANSTTSGSILKLTATEATLTDATGLYFNCYDATGSSSVFSVGENGAVKIGQSNATAGTITAQTGAAATAGSALTLAGGAGGTASTNGLAGGATSLTGGAGSNAGTTNTGGAGGASTLAGGAGGTTATGTAGAGGAISVTAGAGGTASGAGTGGAGGAVTISAGNAGSQTGGTATATGGAVNIYTGNADTSGTDGKLTIKTGGASGSTVLTATDGGKLALCRGSKLVPIIGRTVTDKDAQAATYTIAELLGGVITQNSKTGASTATTPTGAQISAGIVDVAVGDSFECVYYNRGNQTSTITAGASGVTVYGTAGIATLKTAILIFVCTNTDTWSCYVVAGA